MIPHKKKKKSRILYDVNLERIQKTRVIHFRYKNLLNWNIISHHLSWCYFHLPYWFTINCIINLSTNTRDLIGFSEFPDKLISTHVNVVYPVIE